MKINEKIRTLRESNHWSQEEMAQKLNMSKNGYAKIERGETRSTLQRYEQIAQVLNMDICDLLAFDDSKGISVNHSANNHGTVIIGDTEVANLVHHYQQIIALKDEIIQSKDKVIESLRREIQLLSHQSNS